MTTERRTLYLPDGWDGGFHATCCPSSSWRQEGSDIVCGGCRTRVTLTLDGTIAIGITERSNIIADGRQTLTVREMRIVPQPATEDEPSSALIARAEAAEAREKAQTENMLGMAEALKHWKLAGERIEEGYSIDEVSERVYAAYRAALKEQP